MNASALKYDNAHLTANNDVRQTGWQRLGQFATVEEAASVVSRLKDKGLEARTVLIDGVTVIVQGVRAARQIAAAR